MRRIGNAGGLVDRGEVRDVGDVAVLFVRSGLGRLLGEHLLVDLLGRRKSAQQVPDVRRAGGRAGGRTRPQRSSGIAGRRVLVRLYPVPARSEHPRR